MATPIGHTLIGLAVARRLGVRSWRGMAAAAVGANLPDTDFAAGWVSGDLWKFHRKTTHTPEFVLGVGMLGGFAGLVSAGDAEGERDLIADAMTGAAIVGSHWLLDVVKLAPYISTKRGSRWRRYIRNEAVNCTLDVLIFAPLAWALWPREKVDASES